MSTTFSGTGVTSDTGTAYAVQAAAYASGKLIGPLLQINEAGRPGAGSRGGFLTRLCLQTKLSGGITQPMYLHILVGAAPTLSTLTDKTTIVWDASDYAKITKTITVAANALAKVGSSPWYEYEAIDPSNGKPFLPYELGNSDIGAGFGQAQGSNKLRIAVEAGGTITFAAVDDFRLRVAGEHD